MYLFEWAGSEPSAGLQCSRDETRSVPARQCQLGGPRNEADHCWSGVRSGWQAIREALQRRIAVSDAEFDQVFPDELRDRSHQHWTPIEIATRAAEFLAPEPCARVLDVGAGVGKMCLVGALVIGAMWWGVEQDQALVAAATQAAWLLDVGAQTRFVHGDGSRMPWDERLVATPVGTASSPTTATAARSRRASRRSRASPRAATRSSCGSARPQG
jgi:hypothetical protein